MGSLLHVDIVILTTASWEPLTILFVEVTMRRLDKTAPSQIYEVPLIGTDLRQEEFIHQIADSLEYLQHVMDDVFKRVEDRVVQNKTRLTKIQDRTRVAQAKVDHLKGRKKATQVSIICNSSSNLQAS